MSLCVLVCKCPLGARGHQLLGTGITGGYEPPDTGAGN